MVRWGSGSFLASRSSVQTSWSPWPRALRRGCPEQNAGTLEPWILLLDNSKQRSTVPNFDIPWSGLRRPWSWCFRETLEGVEISSAWVKCSFWDAPDTSRRMASQADGPYPLKTLKQSKNWPEGATGCDCSGLVCLVWEILLFRASFVPCLRSGMRCPP